VCGAKQLSEKYSDIPQATLYHYLKQMTTNHIVEENQIRGTVEKVYAVKNKGDVDVEKMLRENNGGFYMQLFSQFVMGLMQELKKRY
jgi:DNA-binding PadR family transcriptional regulator